MYCTILYGISLMSGITTELLFKDSQAVEVRIRDECYEW
jgi:hypothetical protein